MLELSLEIPMRFRFSIRLEELKVGIWKQIITFLLLSRLPFDNDAYILINDIDDAIYPDENYDEDYGELYDEGASISNRRTVADQQLSDDFCYNPVFTKSLYKQK